MCLCIILTLVWIQAPLIALSLRGSPQLGATIVGCIICDLTTVTEHVLLWLCWIKLSNIHHYILSSEQKYKIIPFVCIVKRCKTKSLQYVIVNLHVLFLAMQTIIRQHWECLILKSYIWDGKHAHALLIKLPV